jgi:glycerophosphoryl diester phosphodiesterase
MSDGRRMASVRSPRVWTTGVALVCGLLVLAASAFSEHPSATRTPMVFAHRGGPLELGRARYAEESLASFEARWTAWRTPLELDARLTADRVPVVLHDPTLDRTTTCRGPVSTWTWRALSGSCRLDTAGIGAATRRRPAHARVARLSEVLAFAHDNGAPVLVELKGEPRPPAADPPLADARTVLRTIRAARLPADRLIVESFWPSYLNLARRLLPRPETSLLTRRASVLDLERTSAQGFTWWSPRWPVSPSAVEEAHDRHLKVAPWTVDSARALAGAAASGADAVLTDDPELAGALSQLD